MQRQQRATAPPLGDHEPGEQQHAENQGADRQPSRLPGPVRLDGGSALVVSPSR